MIDLFGLGKKPENHEPEGEGASAPAPEAPVSHGSHRLWAFLLVLDSVFVIVFAGTVAAKVYQHWRAPAPAAVAPRRPAPKPAPKPEAAPAPEEAKSETAAKPEPAPAPKAEAPKPAPDAPRPPKPSLLAEAPKARETPALAPAKPAPKPATGPAPAASGEPAARPKASPVEFKIRSPKAKSVQLVGAFIVRGGRKEMSRDGEGVWSVTVYLHPGSYRYFFSVDKKKVLDPENPQTDRGASVLSVP